MAGQATSIPSNDILPDVEHTKNDAFKALINEYSMFEQDNFTFEEFRYAGIKVVHPIGEEYKHLFVNPNGDYTEAVSAYMAVHVLNPLVTKDMGKDEMTDALKDLNHFKYDEFRAGHGIIDDLIDERCRRTVLSLTPHLIPFGQS